MNRGSGLADILPLSPLQEGLLFQTRLRDDGPDVYLGQTVLTLRGELDADRLRGAAQSLLRRHPQLRAAFRYRRSGEAVALIPHDVTLPWRDVDLAGLAPAERDRRVAALLAEDRADRFDPERPPLLRCTLLRLGDATYRLVLTSHHLVLDGWSTPLLVRDLFAGYADRALPPVTPYRDYLTWLSKQDRVAAEAAWTAALADLAEPTRVAPAGADAPATPPEAVTVDLPAALTAAVSALARSRGITLNTVVQAAWALLLAELTGRTDVVFGTVVSGRPADLPGIESMVGLLINTVPVRVRLDPAEPFDALLARVQDEQARLLEHRHLGLAAIQRLAGLGELFDTLAVFENYPFDPAGVHEPAPGLRLVDVDGTEANHYPLSVTAVPGPRLRLTLGYRTDLVDRAYVERAAAGLLRLCETLAADPRTPVGRIAALDDDERRRTLAAWNATARPVRGESVPELFEARVRACPDATALVCGDVTLSYAELDARADALAARLVAAGVRPGDVVAVVLPRSVELVAALLAVGKAGAAYLPIDPDFPAERVEFMLADARPAVVVTPRWLANGAGAADPAPAVRRLGRAAPAYVLYTSGSTGRPKGVVVPQGALVNFLAGMRDVVGLTERDRLLAVTTVGFDISGLEFYAPLTCGAAVVLADRDTVRDPAALAGLIAGSRATVMQATPTLWQALVSAEPGAVRGLRVLVGGEALPAALAEALHAAGAASVTNLYGPTETTIWSTAHEVGAGGTSPPPIGRPIANTQVHVLDGWLRPVPVGAVGE
ncbi:MAG TPA: AMP-binding protein, partial [Pilimelia sp.]|nr:AMP-binding protein [Pilimelia sp.]